MQRSITVNGAASRSVSSDASGAEIQAAYRAALDDALVAARAKVEFIAGKVGVAVGALESVVEQTDSYPGFCGYSVAAAQGTAGPGAFPAPNKPRKPSRRSGGKHRATPAQATGPNSCPVGAAVTATYLMG
jgi:hypothetical protein